MAFIYLLLYINALSVNWGNPCIPDLSLPPFHSSSAPMTVHNIEGILAHVRWLMFKNITMLRSGSGHLEDTCIQASESDASLIIKPRFSPQSTP